MISIKVPNQNNKSSKTVSFMPRQIQKKLFNSHKPPVDRNQVMWYKITWETRLNQRARKSTSALVWTKDHLPEHRGACQALLSCWAIPEDTSGPGLSESHSVSELIRLLRFLHMRYILTTACFISHLSSANFRQG